MIANPERKLQHAQEAIQRQEYWLEKFKNDKKERERIQAEILWLNTMAQKFRDEIKKNSVE